jgi:hypothetical protein
MHGAYHVSCNKCPIEIMEPNDRMDPDLLRTELACWRVIPHLEIRDVSAAVAALAEVRGGSRFGSTVCVARSAHRDAAGVPSTELSAPGPDRNAVSSVKRKLYARAPGHSLHTQKGQALLLGLSFSLYRLKHRGLFSRMSTEPIYFKGASMYIEAKKTIPRRRRPIALNVSLVKCLKIFRVLIEKRSLGME